MNKLPDKPSELIRLALKDLVRIRDTPGYIVNMDTWHLPRKGKCNVCLAGAVMAGTLGYPRREALKPYAFDKDTKEKLWALDAFRRGSVDAALDLLGLPSNHSWFIPITDYEDDPEQFLMDMTNMANDLAVKGY